MGGLASKRNQTSVSLLIGGSSLQGIRNYNEDRFSIVHPLIPPKIPKDRSTSLFAVYDGHGGEWTAEYAEKHLSECVSEQHAYVGKHKEKALTRGFWSCDNQILAEQEKGAEKSGTTAVCVLLDHDFIYCGNIGDSRALLYRSSKIIELSLDHKPNLPEEKKRIESAGGRVQPSGPVPMPPNPAKRRSVKTVEDHQQNHVNQTAPAATQPPTAAAAPAPPSASAPVPAVIPAASGASAVEASGAAASAGSSETVSTAARPANEDEQPQLAVASTAKQHLARSSLSVSAAVSDHHSKSQMESTQQPVENHDHTDQTALNSQQPASNSVSPNNANSTIANITSAPSATAVPPASTADVIINTATSPEPIKSAESSSGSALPPFHLAATAASALATPPQSSSASGIGANGNSSSSSSSSSSLSSSSSSSTSSASSLSSSSSSSSSSSASLPSGGLPVPDHTQYYAELGDKALAVSRAFGNIAFKQNTTKKPAEQIIVCIPHITKMLRSTSADAFLLLGSDGIFNFISSEDACQFVEYRILKRLSSQLPILPKGERPIITSGEIEEIAGELTQHALDKKSNDNVTAILIVFKEWIDALSLEELKKWRADHKDDSE